MYIGVGMLRSRDCVITSKGVNRDKQLERGIVVAGAEVNQSSTLVSMLASVTIRAALVIDFSKGRRELSLLP